MRSARWISVLSLAFLASLAEATNPGVRIRATEPSVVTVETNGDPVDKRSPQPGPSKGNVKRTVRRGAGAAVKGIVSAVGWWLDTGEDIPNHRDRTRSRSDRKAKGDP